MIHLGRFSHQQRMSVADRLSKLILEKYGERILAVCIYGSTAKNLDRPYSDLEMFVVVKDGLEIPTSKYLHRGLIIGIEFTPESELLKAASRMRWSWPWEADGYRNRIALFERNSWLTRPDGAVAVADKAEDKEAVRSLAMNLTEEMTVFQNSLLTENPVVLKSRSVSLAQAAGDLVLMLNRRFVITTSWFWKQVLECPTKPSQLRELAEILMGVRPSSKEQLKTCAERLFAEMMQIVASRDILVEQQELVV